MWNIFEQPWTLLITAVLSLLGVWLYHSFAPARTAKWHLLIPVSIIAIAFAVDFFIKTDNEKIRAAIKATVIGVEKEIPPVFADALAQNYRDSRHANKTELVSNIELALDGPVVNKCLTSIENLEIKPLAATADITARVIFEEESLVAQTYKQWLVAACRYELEKQPDRSWKIVRIEINKIDGQPFNWSQVPQVW